MKTIGLVPELQVSDFSKSLTFYTDLLGFSVVYSRPEEKFAYIKRGNAEIMLEEPTNPDRTWNTAELIHPYGRGINFQIEVGDVDSLYERTKIASLVPFLDIEEKWYQKDAVRVWNRQFLIQDPDGYLLRFYQGLGTREH